MKNGRPGFKGAMGWSTPVGYTLGGTSIVAGGGVISGDKKLKFFRSGEDATEGNGTGFVLLGFDLDANGGRLAGGFALLSGVKDTVINGQYSPPIPGPIQLAIGVQDLAGTGGSAGTNIFGDDESSQSFFAVATGELKPGIHASIGTGTRRFKGAFGNLSGNIGNNFKGLVEYDGFHWNYGIAYNPGPFIRSTGFEEKEVRSPELTMFLGLTRGKYASWSIVFSF